MLDLIIKNGSCYIDGNLTKTDIGISNSKISHIGNLENEKSKDIFDANNFIPQHPSNVFKLAKSSALSAVAPK